MDIKELAKKILDGYYHGAPKKSLEVFTPQIEGVEFKDFVVEISRWPINFDEVMFTYKKQWQFFSYQDWLGIFEVFVRDGKRYPAQLDWFFMFAYKYLRINLMEVYINMDLDTVNDELRKYFLEHFAECPGLFCIQDDDLITIKERFDIDPSFFDEISEKLVSQGAYKAERIDPTPHEGRYLGINTFTVQGTPPSSWSWVKRTPHDP